MVTYGPWQEPITYTERWVYGVPFKGSTSFGLFEHTIDPVPTYNGEPLTINQWRAAGGMVPENAARVWGSGVESRISVPNGVPPYEDPDFGTDVPSREAWSTAANENKAEITSAASVTGPLAIDYDGGIKDMLPTGKQHTEVWHAESFETAATFRVREGGTNWNALSGVPFNQPPGAMHAELEPARETGSRLVDPVSMRLEVALNADPRWHVVVRDLGGGAGGWLLSADERVVTSGREGTDIGGTGAFDFTVSEIKTWLAGYVQFDNPKIGGQFSVFWAGGWPQNFLGSAPPQYPVLDPDIVLTYRWKAPRWRWVYSDPEVTLPPAIRRTYPRDDGRAGGAGRTFPRPASLQSSNRTVGGYL